MDLENDSGWKTLRPDVLTPPSLTNLLSACVGVGVQLTFTVIGAIILGENGFYYFSKGSLVLAGMILYAVTSRIINIEDKIFLIINSLCWVGEWKYL